MPTKVKGMISLEIAIIAVIVLAIAVAAAWYLYSTFSATVGSSPKLRVVNAYALWNGTIVVEVMNIGSTGVTVVGAYMFDQWYPVRGGQVHVPPMTSVTVYINTGRGLRLGAVVEGKLVTEDGYIIPFTARRTI